MHTVEYRTYQALRRKLLTGELQPGSRLSALAISREMEVSATPVTQAIRRLESEGLVGMVPHYGAFVRQPSAREVAELFDLRRALETFAVRRVACRARPEQVNRLRATCDRWQRMIEARRANPGDERALVKAIEMDLLFHMHIMDIAGNRRALKNFQDCHLLSRVFGGDTLISLNNPLDDEVKTLCHHRQVLEAIAARRPAAAAAALDRHLRDGRRRMIQFLRDPGRRQNPPARSPALARAIVRVLNKVENYQPGTV